MQPQQVRRNILLYRLYIWFNEPLFWGPILIVALQTMGQMSLSDIYFMEGTALVLCVALDIPSGTLADAIGRKKTIVLGRIFLLASTVLFCTMSSAWEAWTADILWAIGFTLQSGADTALLYDTLKASGRESEFKTIEGRALGVRLLLFAVCSAFAGVLAESNIRYPLWASLVCMIVPLGAALLFTEPVHMQKYSPQRQYEILRRGLCAAVWSVHIRWVVGLAALLVSVSKVWFYLYNPYFEMVEIPLTYYGLIFFLLNIVAWFFSHYAARMEVLLGEGRCVLLMLTAITVPLWLMALFPAKPSALLILSQNVVRGFLRPFVGDYVNRHVSTDVRATVLSVQSAVANFGMMAGLFAFGVLIRVFELREALLFLGSVGCVLGCFSYYVYQNKIKGR